MRFLFLIICIFSCLKLSAQDEYSEKQANLQSFSEFIREKVGRIALIELCPYCQGSISQGMLTCHAESIISNQILDTTHINRYTDFPVSEWEKLEKILNYRGGPDGYTACYEPRNGILFYDKNGNVNCYLEICFECSNNSYALFDGFYSGEGLREDQITELKELFRSMGIKYGVEKIIRVHR